jgi:hypothetical protein
MLIMTTIALINRPCFQGAVALPTALRAIIALRPTPLKQGFSTLIFRSIILHELTQAIAFLKLDFVFHDLPRIHFPVLSV